MTSNAPRAPSAKNRAGSAKSRRELQESNAQLAAIDADETLVSVMTI